MATCEQIVSSEAEYDYNCTPCTQRERFTEAKKFCVECGEYFCSTCLSFHEHFGATKGHTLIDCHEVSTGHVAARFTKCKTHENNAEDMFCGEHDVICCRACIGINHRTCKGIDYLPNAAQRFKEDQGEKRSGLENGAKSKIEQLQTSSRENTSRVIQLKIRKGTLLKKLYLFKVSMTELIERLVTDASSDIGNNYEPEICRTQENIQNTDNLLSKLNILSDAIANENDPVILFKKALECKHILGEAEVLQHVPDQKKLTENNEALTQIAKTVRNSMTDDIIFGDVRITKRGAACDIPNMCILSDGSLCLAHFEECKIIHIEKNLTETDTIATEDSVWGVCAINQSKIAFTMPDLKKVQFAVLNENPVLETSFLTKIHCRGISYCDEKLYISGGGFMGEEYGQIHMLDLEGNLLRKFEQGSDGKYFSTPRSVIANTENIFVMDYQNGVICLHVTGGRKWVHRNPNCKFPWGVCFTPKGNILLSGRDSNNIVVVSKNGEYLGELLTGNDGLSKPKSLIIDIPNGRLLVSPTNGSVLKMFSFEDYQI